MKNLLKKFIPPFLIDWYHWFLPAIGAFLYRFPSKKLTVIGVTGTNGKSTVINLATEILEKAGYKVASLSSIKFKIGEREWPNTLKMTMPGRFKLQKFLREGVVAGCQYAVIEVTSEGIKQHRHRFIDFEVAVFTNLTPEHIESHGSFEKYRHVKGKLFKNCKNIHIINSDDPNAEYFLQFPAEKKIYFTMSSSPTAINIDGSRTAIISIKDIQPLNLRLVGEFNTYNALAAICVGLSQGIDLEICRKAVEKIDSIPGRMEMVIQEPFSVIVDYAHTPDSLEKVYQAIPGRKICLLGAAGGGRDRWKRPGLGRIAAKYCNQIILANEDPYEENPLVIIEDIKKGIINMGRHIYYPILDRREAIRKALDLAKPGDTVVITGKGSEPWMCVGGGKKVPWDDRQIVKEEFKKTTKKYEVLEHKADLKIRVFGKNKKELFENAMVGMFESSKYQEEIESQKSKVKIKIKSLDLPSLLVDFLSEVLYLSEINGEVYHNVQFKKFRDKEIEGILIGKKLKRRGVIIKGVTYHDLDVHQKKDKTWQATILFDI